MKDNPPPRPPASGQFKKGVSGNPKGRPRSASQPSPSAFDIVLDRTLTVTQGCKTREITLEEALQQRTYQAALAGDRRARREVLRMIREREKWLEKHAPKPPPPKLNFDHHDPIEINEVLKMLDITGEHQLWKELDPTHDRPRLKTWAVQEALSRPGRRGLHPSNIESVERVCLEPTALRWPRGRQDEQATTI